MYRRTKTGLRSTEPLSHNVREHAIPWPVLVDDLEGAVHGQYAPLPDPSVLIGTDGRGLHRLLDACADASARDRLADGDGWPRGVVGESRTIRPFATNTDGWPAVRRGLPQSFIELETACPGFASGVWLGYPIARGSGPARPAGGAAPDRTTDRARGRRDRVWTWRHRPREAAPLSPSEHAGRSVLGGRGLLPRHPTGSPLLWDNQGRVGA